MKVVVEYSEELYQAGVHFCHYLAKNPLLENKKQNSLIVIGATKDYRQIAQVLTNVIKQNLPGFDVRHLEITEDADSIDSLKLYLEQAISCLFFYDFFTRTNLDFNSPHFIKTVLSEYPSFSQKIFAFEDIKEHFTRVFSVPPERIYQLNSTLIAKATETQKIRYFDGFGGESSLNLTNNQPWDNLNGDRYLLPSEITTSGLQLNGTILFTGTFLSPIPFAVKYGVIDTPLEITIREGCVTDVKTQNKNLLTDFQDYLNLHPNNRKTMEFGIGTNEGIKKLSGLNASFEERHCGLHIGLGGDDEHSIHLDLITNNGCIFFGDEKVHDTQQGFTL